VTVVTTTATDVAVKDRPSDAVVVVIRTGMAPGKAAATPKVVTVGQMETGYIWALHAKIAQTGTKKMPSLRICRVVCRLGAADMEGAMEHIFLN